jgi:ATP/maltotriose-dependent transcriptional regulator MalT
VRSLPHSFFIWNYAVPVVAAHERYTGKPERAQELVKRVLPLGPATEVGHSGVPSRAMQMLRLGAELALDAGEQDEGARWIAAYERWIEWSGYVQGRAEGRLLWARFHRLAGDPDKARAHAETSLALALQPRQPLALIAARRAIAEIDIDERRFEAAGAQLDAALELAGACAAPFERAQTLLAFARLDLAKGDARAALPKLEEVVAICGPLGAEPCLQAASLLREEAAARRGDALLSTRELEVLSLVAEGLTDREIGERLFISPRTVNQHLRSIYNKLEVNSRAAATRKALELDLLLDAG